VSTFFGQALHTQLRGVRPGNQHHCSRKDPSNSQAPAGAQPLATMDMERAACASGSTTSFMSGVDSRAQLGGEPAPDANGYQAVPGSPSKLSDELARRLALADSNPAQPQASWGRQPAACCLTEWLGWGACRPDAACDIR
jgi:hypothetical protein